MAKYRIRIEALDPSEELRAEYRIGIECDGFTIIGDLEDGSDYSIHMMSTVDIAEALANDEELLSAAIIAKAMADAKRMAREMKSEKALEALVSRIREEDD